MLRRLALFATLTLTLSAASVAKDANSVLQETRQAMGAVTSIEYSGSGMNAFFGQALLAGKEWPRRDLSAFTRTINYTQRSTRDQLTFVQPAFGGQQQNTQVNGDKAWSVGPNGPVPQLAAAEERQLHIWLTPHGFVNAATASGNAALKRKSGADVVSFTALGKYKVEGTFDAQHRLTKVATRIANPVLGDTDVTATYSDYRRFNGIQFPGKIAIVQGGFPTWELTITAVTPNAPLDLPVPEAVASAKPPVVQTASSKLADGVWHVTGGLITASSWNSKTTSRWWKPRRMKRDRWR